MFTRTNKGHPHETIGLPTIKMMKTLDDLYPSDEDDLGELEEELASTFPDDKVKKAIIKSFWKSYKVRL